MITIQKRSLFTGKINTMEIPLTEREFQERIHRCLNGELIQEAFSDLSEDEREFLLSGATTEEWNEIFEEE